ncbi:alcohol dehydrogenase catalytic domain-containing protein, partial [bacterium]|nr:alcohol dehydrogenase catalytic domain-containing protein [bacterium]
MKAALLEDIEKLRIAEIDTPKPQMGEVLIKVKACAVCGTDIKIFHHGHRLITFPRVTGHEVTGEIMDVAQDVSKYKSGDRVAVAPAVPCGDCYYCHLERQAMCEN